MGNIADNKGRSRGETLERLKTGEPGRKGKMEGIATKRYDNTIFIIKNIYTKIIVIYADVDGRRFEKEYRCNEKDAVDSFRNFVGSQLY